MADEAGWRLAAGLWSVGVFVEGSQWFVEAGKRLESGWKTAGCFFIRD
jgi:hypothetical protein